MTKKAITTKKQDANNAEIKYAEVLYVERGLTPQAISEELGRNIKTVYAWRDKGKWDDTRRLFQESPLQLKKILTAEAMRIAKGEKRIDINGDELKPIDADSLSKIMKAIDYMKAKISIEIVRDALMKRDYWMAGVDPKRAIEDTKYNKMFLQELISLENG